MSGSLDAIETKKTLQGKDFGELVRQRRRQFGLPLPIADKVLPYRPCSTCSAPKNEPPRCLDANTSPLDPLRLRLDLAKGRIAEAYAALQSAEFRGATSRDLDLLEEAYLAEIAIYEGAVAAFTEDLSSGS